MAGVFSALTDQSEFIDSSNFDGLYLEMIKYYPEFFSEMLRQIHNITPDGQKKDVNEKDKFTEEMEQRQRIKQGEKYRQKEKADFKKILSIFLSIGMGILSLFKGKDIEKEVKARMIKLIHSFSAKKLDMSMFNMDNDSNYLSRLLQRLEQDEPELVLPIVGGQS